MKKPKVLSRKSVFKNEWVNLKVENLLYDKKEEKEYTYFATNSPGVVIVPFFQKTNSLIIVSQYRHPVKKELWQFPGGHKEKGQTFLDIAKIELLEETGYRGDKLIPLGDFYPDVGISSGKGKVYIALDPVKEKSVLLTATEEIKVKQISLTGFEKLIMDGSIRDGWTLGAHCLFKIWQEKNK